MVSRRFAIGTAILCTAGAVLHGDSQSDEEREWAKLDEFSARLREAGQSLPGLRLLNDDGAAIGSIATRPGVDFVGCRSAQEALAAAAAGNIACFDSAIETCSVGAIGDGTYFCGTTGGDEWVASNLDVASAWLSTAVELAAIIDSKVLSG